MSKQNSGKKLKIKINPLQKFRPPQKATSNRILLGEKKSRTQWNSLEEISQNRKKKNSKEISLIRDKIITMEDRKSDPTGA